MKKILTVMTAMTMTLQASDNLEQEVKDYINKKDRSKIDNETLNNAINNLYYSENVINSIAQSNSENIATVFSNFEFHKKLSN